MMKKNIPDKIGIDKAINVLYDNYRRINLLIHS